MHSPRRSISASSPPGNNAVYYSFKTPDGPRAFVHHMGEDASKDPIIFGKDLGKDKIITLQLSEAGTSLVYGIIYGSGSEQADIYVQNVKENGPILTAVNNQKSLFFPTFAGDHLFHPHQLESPPVARLLRESSRSADRTLARIRSRERRSSRSRRRFRRKAYRPVHPQRFIRIEGVRRRREDPILHSTSVARHRGRRVGALGKSRTFFSRSNPMTPPLPSFATTSQRQNPRSRPETKTRSILPRLRSNKFGISPRTRPASPCFFFTRKA